MYIAHQSPENRAHQPADDDAGRENATGAAGFNGQRSGQNFGENQYSQQRQADPDGTRGHRQLRPTVTNAEHLRQPEGNQPGQQSADGRFQDAWEAPFVEDILDEGESPCSEDAEQAAANTQDAVINQTDRVAEGNVQSGAENRGKSLDGSVDDVGNHEEINAGIRTSLSMPCRYNISAARIPPPRRSFKDGGNTGAHTGGHGNTAVFDGKMGDLCNKRAETGAHLRSRAFRTCAAAGADSNRRGDKLHIGDAPADVSVFIMVSVDSGIGAVAFSFRRQFINDKSGKQTAQCGD